MAAGLTASILVVLAFASAASAYTSRISLCICTGESVEEQQCGLLEGILYQGSFIVVDEDNNEFRLSIENIRTHPYKLCAGQPSKRYFVHGGIHAGVVDVSGKIDVDKGGHVSGEVSGKVNVDGAEVGAKVGVDKGGHVSAGASVGVGLGRLGGVDVHVSAGQGGVKAGVGAHIDVGPLHGSASVDVDQHGKLNAGASGQVDLGHEHVDIKGQVIGRSSGKRGIGPGSIGGNINDKGHPETLELVL